LVVGAGYEAQSPDEIESSVPTVVSPERVGADRLTGADVDWPRLWAVSKAINPNELNALTVP
jgi:hypothetical protein